MAQAPHPLTWLRRVARFLHRENLHRILLALVVMGLLAALGLWVLEGDAGAGKGSFADWLWWSIVTLTTVGYGDITPMTPLGRLIGIFLMFCGIGVLSMLTATIAGFFVEMRLKRERGMGSYDLRDHIILCQWNHRAEEILRELRSDRRTADSAIVLLADVDSKPVDDDRLHFVRGSVSEETLRRAGIERAATVVILGDSRLDASARDAQVVLATLAVETLNPDVYTIVELVDEENVRHCQRARADEIVVGHQFSSRLLATAAVDHGMSKVVSELLSQRFGHDLCRLPLPKKMAGREFFDVFCEMKKANSAITVAVQRDGEVVINPASDYRLAAGDHLIAITEGD